MCVADEYFSRAPTAHALVTVALKHDSSRLPFDRVLGVCTMRVSDFFKQCSGDGGEATIDFLISLGLSLNIMSSRINCIIKSTNHFRPENHSEPSGQV